MATRQFWLEKEQNDSLEHNLPIAHHDSPEICGEGVYPVVEVVLQTSLQIRQTFGMQGQVYCSPDTNQAAERS